MKTREETIYHLIITYLMIDMDETIIRESKMRETDQIFTNYLLSNETYFKEFIDFI